MARKIFVTYKYGDTSVRPLLQVGVTKVRDYVNLLQDCLDEDHIYKGEDDGEDLSSFKDETIESALRDKIYDSSMTLILISKNMREYGTPEADQWIPWEIAYSLREQTRGDRTSRMNALAAIVLPDEQGSYEYFIQENTCPDCNSKTLRTHELFRIMRDNMFNRKEPKLSNCKSHLPGDTPHIGDDHSYIYPVKWDDFIGNLNHHIDISALINQNAHEYEIVKSIS